MRFLITVLLAMGALIGGYGQCQAQPHYTQIKIGTATLRATIASTNEEHRRGLQGVAYLGPNEGKLFIFKDAQIRNFWMKDMQIPLDILWIDDNKKIVYLSQDVPVCKQDPCPLYPSVQPARYVLEVNAGFAAAHHLAIGMPVDFSA